ncbi:MAG: DUF6069 family protein [Candidatus Heimdallarchaeota archaeon]
MSDEEKIEISRLLKYGSLVIIAAIVFNTFVYLISNLFGIFNDEIINPNTNKPIPMSEIIIVSIFQMVIGLIGFAFVTEITKQPIRLFRGIASIFLVLSFYLPLTIKRITVGAFLALGIMHLISGFLMIVVLPRLVTSNKQLDISDLDHDH